MNQPQSPESSSRNAETHVDTPTHRRGGSVESPGHPVPDREDPEHLGSDEAEDLGQSPESQAVDETDVLSMGGPDSLEEVEDGDDEGDAIDQ